MNVDDAFKADIRHESASSSTPITNNDQISYIDKCNHAMEEFCYNVDRSLRPIVKMDSACSRCMSGIRGRLLSVRETDNDIHIKGFNNTTSIVTNIGYNEDNKMEYYVSSMPNDLVLLCANDYAQDGAVILLKDEGYVIKLSQEEADDLVKMLHDYPITKRLMVNNRTYEVETSYSATKYFNTNVNVSNVEERILTYLISGITLRDLYRYVQFNNVTGLHPDVTVQAINNFKHRWGSTPDAYQLANPSKHGNKKGYMTEPVIPTQVGDMVEMDYLEPDYNEATTIALNEDQLNGLKRRTKVKKLATHGGAVAAAVIVDCFSGYIIGQLVKTTAKPIDIVKQFVQLYELANHTIKEFAADSGVNSQSIFQVFTPEVSTYLLSKLGQKDTGKVHNQYHIIRSEPHNHSNGTPTVENVIKLIKARKRMAINYILRNPNFQYLQFNKEQILQLWGELFYWAITVINLSASPHVPTKTRYEVFLGKRPNIQEIRLLPIFSIVMGYRYTPTKEIIDQSNMPFYQYGLYVGPDLKVSGAIRLAVITNNRVEILVTTKYKAVSDGGGMNIYPIVQQGTSKLIQETTIEANDNDNNAQTDNDNDNRAQTDNDNNVQIDDDHDDTIAYDNISTSNDIPITNTTSFIDYTSVYSSDPSQHATHPMNPLDHTNELRGSDNDSDSEKINNNDVTIEVSMKKQKQVKVYDPTKHLSRDERMKLKYMKSTDTEANVAYFTDWSTHSDNEIYYSFELQAYVVIDDKGTIDDDISYKAVKGPKSFQQALDDVKWGDPARLELSTVIEEQCIVKTDNEIALEDIKNGASLVILFPVYEEKIKDGQTVYKVRLVGNGKTHYNAGETYSPTPSKEELLILLHIAASKGWDYVHIDESRAFLKAKYNGDSKVYARIQGDNNTYYKVVGALYGLKTSNKDYSKFALDRLIKLGFNKLQLCNCIVYKYVNGHNCKHIIFVYMFVDDYIIFSDNTNALKAFVDEYCKVISSTKPIWNATAILGYTIVRDWDKHTIQLSVANKIMDIAKEFKINESKVRHVPLPSTGYIVHDYEFENLKNQDHSVFLNKKETITYMRIVGTLIWIQGIRYDILFSVMYLTWFTKQPRVHHMLMALHVLSYLYHHKDIPLVLGGTDKIHPVGESDSSWATGPQRRSITGALVKLGPLCGAITAKATASHTTPRLSSYESELEGVTLVFKILLRIKNLLTELTFTPDERLKSYNDNESMLKFLKDYGTAKGVRHMELRMWYIRDQIRTSIDVLYRKSSDLTTDHMTKPTNRISQEKYTNEIMGLKLL